MSYQEIKIANLVIEGERHERDGIAGLADSIEKNGQLNPIVVRPHGKGKFFVVAGRRRIRAAEFLGRDAVECNVQPLDGGGESDLVEVDENLYRQDYDALERAEALEKRARVLEVIYGEKRKADEQVAKESGSSSRTVRRARRLAGISDKARDKIRGTTVAGNQNELEALAKVPEEHQVKVASRVAKHKVTVKEATRAVARKGRAGRDWPDKFDDIMSLHRQTILTQRSKVDKEFNKLTAIMRRLAKDAGMAKLEGVANEMLRKKKAMDYIFSDWAVPVGPCPYCDGGGCKQCAGDGWSTDGAIRNEKKNDGKDPKKWRLG